jgi:hypothetical protein
MELIN